MCIHLLVTWYLFRYMVAYIKRKKLKESGCLWGVGSSKLRWGLGDLIFAINSIVLFDPLNNMQLLLRNKN